MKRVIIAVLVGVFTWCCSAKADLNEKSAAELSANWTNQSSQLQLKSLVDLTAYYSKNNTKLALSFAAQALARLQQTPDPALQAQVLNDQAFALYYSNQSADAVTTLAEVQRLASEFKLDEASGRASMILGYIFRDAGLAEQALVQQQKALIVFDRIGAKARYASSLKNIADLLIDQNQNAQVERYISLLEQSLQQQPEASKALLYELKADVAANQGDNEKALSWYLESLHEHEKFDYRVGQHTMCAAIAYVLNDMKRSQLAIHYVNQGLAILGEGGSVSRYINLMREKARALTSQGDVANARQLLLELSDRARQLQDIASLAPLYSDLVHAAQLQNDWRTAFEYQKQYEELNQKILSENISKRMALLDMTFQRDRKENEIKLLKSENQVQQLALAKQRERLVVTIIFALLVLSVFTFYAVRKQHRKELAREMALNAKLRELDQLKDQVLANTSHELRTPLNGIVGLSELLLHGELESHVRSHVELIAESGRRLTDVVNELLDFARLKQNKLAVDLQPISLSEAVSKAIHLSGPAAAEKHLTLLNQVSPDLPFVLADAGRVQQIILNLLSNAIKFTNAGEIKFEAKRVQNHIELSVIDTGVGIDPKYQAQIFEAFQQADGSSSRRHEGAGLGLTIAQHLVHLQGGEIGVESALNRGSRFWFSLPIAH